MDWLIAVRSSVAEWILVARVVVGGSSPSSWPVLRAIVTLALPRRLTTKQPPPKKQRSGSKSQMASLLRTLLRFARGKPFWPNWPKTLRNSNTNIFVLLKTQKTCLLIMRSLGFVGSYHPNFYFFGSLTKSFLYRHQKVGSVRTSSHSTAHPDASGSTPRIRQSAESWRWFLNQCEALCGADLLYFAVYCASRWCVVNRLLFHSETKSEAWEKSRADLRFVPISWI